MVIAVFILGATSFAGTVSAQSPRSVSTLSFTVGETTSLEVQGTPEISIGQPGDWAVTEDGAASYSLITNKGASKDIRASLDQSPPEGIAFEVRVQAPEPRSRGQGGATPPGWTSLGANESAVLKNIKKVDDRGVPIRYRALADEEVVPGSYVFTVTYTISTVN